MLFQPEEQARLQQETPRDTWRSCDSRTLEQGLRGTVGLKDAPKRNRIKDTSMAPGLKNTPPDSRTCLWTQEDSLELKQMHSDSRTRLHQEDAPGLKQTHPDSRTRPRNQEHAPRFQNRTLDSKTRHWVQEDTPRPKNTPRGIKNTPLNLRTHSKTQDHAS